MTRNEIIELHYKKNFSTLVKKFYRAAGSTHGAEDIVHDAYERALKYYSEDHIKDFDPWFSVVLRNSLRDFKRAERGYSEDVEVDEYDHVGAYCSGLSDKHWREIIQLINRKSEAHKEVLTLYFLKGFSYKDISKITRNTYFNAYKIVSRFKEELVKRYGK